MIFKNDYEKLFNLQMKLLLLGEIVIVMQGIKLRLIQATKSGKLVAKLATRISNHTLPRVIVEDL